MGQTQPPSPKSISTMASSLLTCALYFITVMINQEWEQQGMANSLQRSDTPPTPKQQDPPSPPSQLDEQQPPTLFEELHSANPILPPGIHLDKIEARALKYKLVQERGKLNKTTFPEVRAKNWLNKTHLGNSKSGQSIREEEQQAVMESVQQFGSDSEFKTLLEDKQFAYMRVNNANYNRVGPNNVCHFASFFVNSRRDSIVSQKTPVYEYLPRISKELKPYNFYTSASNVQFDSKFESGNLFCALFCPKEPLPTYQLYMQNDTNTKGCTQWFYFRLSTQKRTKLRLRIMNFYKPTSLYMKGMKVLVSCSDGLPGSKSQWRRVGTAIQYKKVSLGEGNVTYAMQFIYEVENPHQNYYFAYGYPYTYSHLEEYLNRVANDMPLYHRVASRTNICKSYLGNNVPLLTISEGVRSKNQPMATKPIIYIIGRQHPGETPGSFIMEGVIRTLLSNRVEMEQLREQFTIKVIPMVNVDGVVSGNYRSNFSGNDINRQWAFPSKKLHPELHSIKQEILGNKRNVHFFLDIHAHSRKMNSFFYGSKPTSMDARLYPFICSKLNKHISFKDCSFVDDPSKKTTGRVVLETEGGIKRSLTFEASFYGYEEDTKKSRVHFKADDFRNIGQSLALALFYSEVGVQRVRGESTMVGKLENSSSRLDVTSGKVSASCRLGNEKPKKMSEMERKVEKNVLKMHEKWRKQIERFRNEQDCISEGSSLDPEHFQLKEQEQEQLKTLLEHLNNKESQNKNQGIQESPDSQTKQPGVLVLEGHKKSLKKVDLKQHRVNEKTLQINFDSQGEPENTRVSFFPFQSNLRNTQMVKKLESELQVQRTHRRYGSINKELDRYGNTGSGKSVQFKNQLIRGERFKSIEVEQPNPNPNYRHNIIEMKKALKYFIENKTYNYKSADYDDYKNFLRSSTKDKALVLGERESLARIKKKYARL